MVVYRAKFYSLLNTLLLVALVTWLPASAAQSSNSTEVAISVDKNPIVANDTFILTLTVNQLVSDTLWQPQQALQEFEVLGSSSSRNTQIINGVTTEQTTFNTIVRAPADAGDYAIGPVHLLDVQSNSLNLEVVAAEQSDKLLDQRKAFIKVELNRDQVYVQEQVQLTAKLYLAANLHSGNIIPPKLEQADIRQVGRDSETSEIINGRKFQVFSRDFVVIPQRSGEQVIQGPLFQGQINVKSKRTLFPTFSSTESITTAAEDLPLRVQPIPPSWPTGHDWLPAELVTLSVSVGSESAPQDTEEQQFSQGEPINLTYRLSAIGPLPDQLPRLDELVAQLAIPGASIYPEAPESSANQRNGRLISQQTVRVAVIPHQAGELRLPELTLPWFNTQLRQQDNATAPAQQFAIIAKAGGTGVDSPQSSQPVTNAAETSTPTNAATSTEVEETPVAASTVWYQQVQLWQLLTLLFALLWLLTLLAVGYLARRKQRANSSASATNATSDNYQQHLKALKHACTRNDAAAVELLLKRWARHYAGRTSAELSGVADELDHAPLRSQIEHLQRCRFAAGSANWHEGKALWRAFQAALKAAEQRQQETGSVLPDLYPR
ncbi:hypothetical protein PSI9734_00130 [Pseudidiomarina piscicola]|uniref:DUF7939 domain-containing protein n=1 Tax=Pseudidiomarina piscicola TaxID=2614830 RepID=A0A6S6WK65_9GAMM|nr:BatD family protein [Pseudidiomarina piscicola]CAB0149560.1 hypothetical protein PSI9734_00130 [Pseudidiomarina piscicola]VZT39008.1 hypothetical protein PSI9734_00130 [Pseudomonas aeruginosa]